MARGRAVLGEVCLALFGLFEGSALLGGVATLLRCPPIVLTGCDYLIALGGMGMALCSLLSANGLEAAVNAGARGEKGRLLSAPPGRAAGRPGGRGGVVRALLARILKPLGRLGR